MKPATLLPLFVYTLLICWIGQEIFFSPLSVTLGILGTDTVDTLSLRQQLFNSNMRFWPTGYSFWQLTPNILDHLLALPFVAVLGFPLGDNLWWFCVLLANAGAAHHFGKELGGPSAGYFAGVALLCSEQLLREVNLHHAPQSLLFFPLLYVLYLLKVDAGDERSALQAGIFLGLSALSYLYYLPFMVLGTLPWLWANRRSSLRIILPIAGLFTLPNLLFLWVVAQPMMNIPQVGSVQGLSMLDAHSTDLSFIWKAQPMDTTNQLSFVLLIAALWNPIKSRWWWMIGIGITFLLGSGANDALPFDGLRMLPGFSRLMWPERWGILVLFGTIALALRSPYKGWLALLLCLEMHIRSHNLPLHSEPTSSYACYQELRSVKGVLLELPIKNNDLLYNRSALYQRLHQQPMANPFVLPPQVPPPQDWEEWRRQEWVENLDNPNVKLQQSDVDSLFNSGISAIVIDTSSFAPISVLSLDKWKKHLSPMLGKPVNLGCLLIWPLKEMDITPTPKRIQHPLVDLPLLMDPLNKR